MKCARKWCDGAYWLALTLWVGVLIAGGVAATASFTILPKLGINLEQYQAYDLTAHGRIAAGKMMEAVFTFVDVVQLVMCLLVLGLVLLQWTVFHRSIKRPANLMRMACLVLATGTFAWRALTLTPEMNRDLRAFWIAAEAGEVQKADQHRDAFSTRHPVASRWYGATFCLLLIVVVVSPAALADDEKKRSLVIEPPDLLRRTGR